MCSCATASGGTVSVQRHAAFSSCSRGAIAPAGAPGLPCPGPARSLPRFLVPVPARSRSRRAPPAALRAGDATSATR